MVSQNSLLLCYILDFPSRAGLWGSCIQGHQNHHGHFWQLLPWIFGDENSLLSLKLRKPGWKVALKITVTEKQRPADEAGRPSQIATCEKIIILLRLESNFISKSVVPARTKRVYVLNLRTEARRLISFSGNQAILWDQTLTCRTCFLTENRWTYRRFSRSFQFSPKWFCNPYSKVDLSGQISSYLHRSGTASCGPENRPDQ